MSDLPAPFDPGGEITIAARGLVKRFGEFTAVEGVDLDVRRGEFFGFLGPNGHGKTTTIRMLTGLARPTAGWIRVTGRDPVLEPLEVKSRIGYLPEEVNTYERLTGRELLAFSGAMHGLRGREIAARTEQLLSLVALPAEDADRMIVDYSRGMKKKIGLASALIHGPEVLFLDEPLSGVDTLSSRAIREALVELTRRGVTIFFTSHVLETVERVCPRIGLIRKGRVVGVGTVPELAAAAGLPAGATLEEIFVKVMDPERREAGASLEWFHR